MKWAVYNVAFALIFPFLLPGFLVRMLRRGGYRSRMGDRFSCYPKTVNDRFRVAGEVKGEGRKVKGDSTSRPSPLVLHSSPIWVHAVSVGEVQVALQLMREWRKAEPDVSFCFSTTSSTGWKIAEAGVTDRDTLIYNPLDFPNFVKSALATVRPRAVVLTESEIWPVFIRRARKTGIPLFLVNARVSDRSAPRYKAARWLFKDVFGCFTRIFAQSRLDADRLVAAGAPADRLDVTGSFKFDVAHRNPAKEAELREWLGPTRRILLGASTWPGEDAALLDIYRTLPDDVTLVLAPRHFEKADAVEANIVRAGFTCVRRSRGDAPAGARCVYLADTTGELMGLYGLADAVFVGKSLCAHGSQNMIEPCLCGKPTVVGPYTENFRPVMSDLLEQNAIVQVPDAAALGETLRRWFAPDGSGEAKALGERAARAVASRTGVVPRCVAAIRAAVPSAPSSATERHPRRSRRKSIVLGLLVVGVLLAMLSQCRWHARRDWRQAEAEAREEYRYKPLQTILDFIPRLESPDGSGGVEAQPLDARKMTMAAFKAALDAFPCADAHLWMVGEEDWLLTGRTGTDATNAVPLSAMLELFDDEETFAALAAAQCTTLPEFFACYVGDRATLAGAFAANAPDSLVRPEYFVTRDIPATPWIATDDLDADIRDLVRREMRSMQVVRRNIIEGNMLARAGNMDDAIEKWATAMLRNPNDPMLLDRLHRLAVNAVTFQKVGNVKAATKCYETMVCVRPRDVAAITEYAKCLRQLGQIELSDEVMARARTLMENQKDED